MYGLDGVFHNNMQIFVALVAVVFNGLICMCTWCSLWGETKQNFRLN